MKMFLCISLLLCVVSIAACQPGGSPGADNGAAVEEQLFSVDGDFAGSHILVAYAGAMRAASAVTRTKDQARLRADSLIALLKDDPSRFEPLAEAHSDDPSAAGAGGSLGTWFRGQMVAEFDTAIDALQVGAITEQPVETAFGYHIIRRNSLEIPHYGVDAFIVAFARPDVPQEITRSPEEARVLSEDLKTRLTPDNFEELGTEYNDLGEEPFVFIGGMREGSNAPPELLDAVKGLAIGGVAGPIELPVGYAFVRRTRLEQRAGAHILIPYAGAMRADPSLARTKEEALEHANRLIAQLKQDPDKFAEFARENPDMTGANGGDLGMWFKGSMVPAFEDAVSGLEIGAITEVPVETDFGYHIIQRTSPIR
jgi:parvulin-like peptidyl-prolyl isomerase